LIFPKTSKPDIEITRAPRHFWCITRVPTLCYYRITRVPGSQFPNNPGPHVMTVMTTLRPLVNVVPEQPTMQLRKNRAPLGKHASKKVATQPAVPTVPVPAPTSLRTRSEPVIPEPVEDSRVEDINANTGDPFCAWMASCDALLLGSETVHTTPSGHADDAAISAAAGDTRLPRVERLLDLLVGEVQDSEPDESGQDEDDHLWDNQHCPEPTGNATKPARQVRNPSLPHGLIVSVPYCPRCLFPSGSPSLSCSLSRSRSRSPSLGVFFGGCACSLCSLCSLCPPCSLCAQTLL
jgi:hypothetical protein